METATSLSPTTSAQRITLIGKIKKRDGSLANFDLMKISTAAYKAMIATGEGTDKHADRIARRVLADLLEKSTYLDDYVPYVEDIQDLVEKYLMRENLPEAAKAYILYRQEHAERRKEGKVVSEEVKKLVEESSKYFRNPLAEFVYYRTYSKWDDEKGRRETWMETVDRFMSFMHENLGDKLTDQEYQDVRDGIYRHDVIPSMRLVWSSGPAARKTNVAAYNCSFISPTRFQDFGEIMYVLMCGTGLGFSVESQTAQALPMVKKQTGEFIGTHTVEDSKEGWANAYIKALETWYDGKDLGFDYSQVRPKGARLKTMGGRASGPQPLMNLMEFSKKKILARQGKRLTNLDIHDIICKIGEIVVAGGVRRSALISLSDLEDENMRMAKHGQFYTSEPQRSMANNSAVYETKPTTAEFLEEWIALMKSGSGERGLFNRGGLERQLPERRWEKFKDHAQTGGTNPCGEIILRSRQFCNLTSIVVRAEDSTETLKEKVRLATILGTYQASLTNFPYLSKEWKENCEDEALLGVSFTGYYDNEVIRRPEVLRKLRDYSVDVNKDYAERLGINQSTCVTCVKPSGNSSQLLDTSSGMHPRYAKYYIRRIRISATDPLFRMLKDQGIPYHPEVGQTEENATTFVLEFPVKAPEGAITRNDVKALDMLEEWKKIKTNFTEHNPSVTIYVDEDEWLDVGNWVYNNWDIVGGISFLPKSEHVYQLAPYEEIDREKYEELSERIGEIEFAKLVLYEQQDNTEGAKELACVAGGCEI